jgi:glycosyltransferase involved in cell wall biosynthesis
MDKISVIIPCFHNEQNIPVTADALLENEKLFPADVVFEYIMVDDGSKDGTLQAIHKFREQHAKKVTVVKLSGNFGAYNAILAGMEYATGNCNVVMAADLQDPPGLILKMYEYWKRGIKLVVANRVKRKDGVITRLFANVYQKLVKRYALSNLPDGGFDFCLFDEQLRKQVVEMKEKNTNSLYLLMWLKYDFVTIPYTRQKRQVGTSQWTAKKKLKLFIDSFVSFSYAPLRVITMSGLLLGLVALLYAVYIIIIKLNGLVAVEGWTTLMVVFLLVSAFQMISIGILGEYLWRSLEASRQRPAYIVENVELSAKEVAP